MSSLISFDLPKASGNLIPFLVPGTVANQTGFGTGLRDSIWPGFNLGTVNLAYAQGNPDANAIVVHKIRGKYVLGKSKPETFTLEQARQISPDFINWAFGPLGIPNTINAGNHLAALDGGGKVGDEDTAIAFRFASENLQPADIFNDSRVQPYVSEMNNNMGLPPIPPFWLLDGYVNLIDREDPLFRERLLSAEYDNRGRLMVDDINYGPILGYGPTTWDVLQATRDFKDKKLVIRRKDKAKWTAYLKYCWQVLRKYYNRDNSIDGICNVVGVGSFFIGGFFRGDVFTGGMLATFYKDRDKTQGVIDYLKQINHPNAPNTLEQAYAYIASVGGKFIFTDRSIKAGTEMSNSNVFQTDLFGPAKAYFESDQFFETVYYAEDINLPKTASFTHQACADWGSIISWKIDNGPISTDTSEETKYLVMKEKEQVNSRLTKSGGCNKNYSYDDSPYGQTCGHHAGHYNSNNSSNETYMYQKKTEVSNYSRFIHWPTRKYAPGVVSYEADIQASKMESGSSSYSSADSQSGSGRAYWGSYCCASESNSMDMVNSNATATYKYYYSQRMGSDEPIQEYDSTNTGLKTGFYSSQTTSPGGPNTTECKPDSNSFGRSFNIEIGAWLGSPVQPTQTTVVSDETTKTITQTAEVKEESNDGDCSGTAVGNYLGMYVLSLAEPYTRTQFQGDFKNGITGDTRYGGGDYKNNPYTLRELWIPDNPDEEDGPYHKVTYTKDEKTVTEVYNEIINWTGEKVSITDTVDRTMCVFATSIYSPWEDLARTIEVDEQTERFRYDPYRGGYSFYYDVLYDGDDGKSCHFSNSIVLKSRFPTGNMTGKYAYLEATITDKQKFAEDMQNFGGFLKEGRGPGQLVVGDFPEYASAKVLPCATPGGSDKVILTCIDSRTLDEDITYLEGLRDDGGKYSGIAAMMLERRSLFITFYEMPPPYKASNTD